MRRQFGTCSYRELTNCIRARIEWIREHRAFRRDPNAQKYGHVRVGSIFTIIRNEHEIRRLLKMRRELKRSGRRSWDPDRHDACMDLSPQDLAKLTDAHLIGELVEAVKDREDERLASPDHLANVRDEVMRRLARKTGEVTTT